MKIFKLLKRISSIKFYTDSNYRFLNLSRCGFYDNMPDDLYIKRLYRVLLGKELNLDNPKTFNEKLQWLKLYNRRPEYTSLVDKYKVRDYIKEIIGEKYLIPLLGIWNDSYEIDFDSLPNQFVLKCNHNSGGMCICREKSLLNIDDVRKKLNNSLKEDYYLYGREWPYKNVTRKILAEQYMKNHNDKDLNVYKFMCFNGKPQIIQFIQHDKTKYETVDYYDTDWEKLNIRQAFPNSNQKIEKPSTFNEMLRIASKLSFNQPFIRVDLYEIDERVYFSELTFYSDAGFGRFFPEDWDNKLGNLIELPN